MNRPSRQYLQAWQGRDGETPTSCPIAQAIDTFAQRRDVARHFMAEDHRFLQANGAKAAVIEVMQVGAANAAGCKLDRDLARTGRYRHRALQCEDPLRRE